MRKLTDEEFQASMEKAIALQGDTNKAAAAAMRLVMEQREEILQAFVAQHGFNADECVQVEFKTPEGGFGWCVRKRKEGEP